MTASASEVRLFAAPLPLFDPVVEEAEEAEAAPDMLPGLPVGSAREEGQIRPGLMEDGRSRTDRSGVVDESAGGGVAEALVRYWIEELSRD